MFGGFALGFVSDRFYGKRSPVGAVAIIISFMISLSITIRFQSISSISLAVSLFFLGLLLGGLNHILCVTCAADLG
jgi:sugar phosphate permease